MIQKNLIQSISFLDRKEWSICQLQNETSTVLVWTWDKKLKLSLNWDWPVKFGQKMYWIEFERKKWVAKSMYLLSSEVATTHCLVLLAASNEICSKGDKTWPYKETYLRVVHTKKKNVHLWIPNSLYSSLLALHLSGTPSLKTGTVQYDEQTWQLEITSQRNYTIGVNYKFR